MKFLCVLTAGAIAMYGAASAHSGPKILQAGGADTRTNITGALHAHEKGVSVFRGRRALLGEEPVIAPGAPEQVELAIEVRTIPYRSFRRLRTQGFYSGTPYPSRQYVQGFFAGKR